MPMVILGAFFFLFVPDVLLLAITGIGDMQAVAPDVARPWRSCPQQAQAADPGRHRRRTATSYALAVYLFAPIAVVVPLTISTAVGAVDHRRRARAGHRRVPGPLPRRA